MPPAQVGNTTTLDLSAVECSESSIANAAVANHAAVLEFEVTEIGELLLLSGSDERKQMQRKQSTDYTD